MGRFEILLRYFLRKTLRLVGYVTNREREYEFVYRCLGVREGRVLDVGCSDSLLAYRLAAMGFDVYGIDVRDYPFRHKRLTFVKGNVTDKSILQKLPRFDYITCVSTLEHVGLGYYEDMAGSGADKVALLNMHSLLRDNGFLILTVPFSVHYTVDKFERVYNYRALMNLFDDWRVVEERYHIPFGLKNWVIADRESAERIHKAYPRSNNACFLLQKE